MTIDITAVLLVCIGLLCIRQLVRISQRRAFKRGFQDGIKAAADMEADATGTRPAHQFNRDIF
jgi:hypothetical protein